MLFVSVCAAVCEHSGWRTEEPESEATTWHGTAHGRFSAQGPALAAQNIAKSYLILKHRRELPNGGSLLIDFVAVKKIGRGKSSGWSWARWI